MSRYRGCTPPPVAGHAYKPYRCHPDLVSVPGEKSISYTNARRQFIENDKAWDLATPDGEVVLLERSPDRKSMTCVVTISGISSRFAGWSSSYHMSVVFNLKSTLSQLGINGTGTDIKFNPNDLSCTLTATLTAISPLGVLALDEVTIGTQVGKLFCRDTARRVTDSAYLTRLISRVDRKGVPLVHLGDEGNWECENIDGRVIFKVKLREGIVRYDGDIHGLLPAIGKCLRKRIQCKHILRLHQHHDCDKSRLTVPNQMLMVRTYPLMLRNCYARVAVDLLPEGISCCSSNILEPVSSSRVDEEEGRTFCFYGNSPHYLTEIPFEIYQLEPWREHLYFGDGLKNILGSNPQLIFKAFSEMNAAPSGTQMSCYIVKKEQLQNLRAQDWISTTAVKSDYPGITEPEKQRESVRQYIQQQSCYGILKAISIGDITSHGVLFCKYLPSPVLKNLLLSDTVSACLKQIYFETCSKENGCFLSQEDRSLLYDLSLFGVEVFNVATKEQKMFKYVHKKGRDHGAFVPVFSNDLVGDYLNATSFGVYGSNLKQGDLENELMDLMNGIKAMRDQTNHPLLHPGKALAIVTGGGPGAMEVGNRVAQQCGILSCGNICDFSKKGTVTVNEQKRNPFVDVWMTYKLEKLVERQSDFQLDFPIFLLGGIGTDFEFGLEEVRRKVGTTPPTPMILFGASDYWEQKITSRYTRNTREGVIKGSEWISNCFYAAQTAAQALAVYKKWFAGKLLTGPEGPVYERGFCELPADVDSWNPVGSEKE
eukprot:TRINITY_DN4600_c2_g1_i2.p1 TRINITY_DN4600_c2_g1~~TRINITY_DN4600_c2_g1_i2.p1  ORF type:complete len:781 (+),score=142.61 TRINITY_DN4600_c2_g1_i2:45-2345(+)